MPTRNAMKDNRAKGALDEAEALGLLSGSPSVEISIHVPRRLLDTAKERAGVRSNKQLLLIALSLLATRDEFAECLLARKGTIDPSVDLEL
jgi:hypothetical protein